MFKPTPQSPHVIDARNLTKRYPQPASFKPRSELTPGKLAINQISLQVTWGEIIGIMGPNGAGKSTLLKVLCTLIRPDSGEATIAGHPLSEGAKIRQQVGLVLGDDRSFYWRLTGRQNLVFFGALHGLFGQGLHTRIDYLFEQLNLQEVADMRFDRYSSGMKQRLGICRALLHDPSILFLDEATRSLDQAEKVRFETYLKEQNETNNLTIVLVTHDPMETSTLCHRFIQLESGKRVVD